MEDIFFRYEYTMTHYSVDKMADAAGEDADVELKQNREDISLRLDGETRDDLSERYLEWVPVQTPEPQEWLILTHELAKKRDDLPSLDWWLEPEREETVEQKTSEELRREREEARRELDESLRQERIFQIEKRRITETRAGDDGLPTREKKTTARVWIGGSSLRERKRRESGLRRP